MGNVSSIKTNYILNTIIQLLLIITPFITMPYVSRVLGVESVGEYSYSASIVSYFVFTAVLGSSTYGQRQIAFDKNDNHTLSLTFWNTFTFRVITTFASTGLYFIYLVLSNNMNLLCVIMSVNIINVSFDINWFFQGLENFKQVAIKNIIIKLISTALIFILIKKPSDLWLYALIIVLSTAIGSISIWISIRGKISHIKISEIKPFNNFKDIILIFLPTIAIEIYTILDKSMIGWFSDSSSENGYYEVAEKMSRLSLTIVTSLGAVILPRVAFLFKNNKLHEAKEYIKKAYKFIWMFSIPITLGLIAVSSVFVPVFFGDDYSKSIVLLEILSLLVIFVGLANVTGIAYLIPTKQQNIYTISVTIAAVINIIMNLILIPKYYSVGAAISTITAEGIGCSIQIGYCIIKKQLRMNDIIFASWKYMLSGSLMFVLVFLLKTFFFDSGVISLIILIVSGVTFYFTFLLLIKDSFLIKNLKSLFRIKGGKNNDSTKRDTK